MRLTKNFKGELIWRINPHTKLAKSEEALSPEKLEGLYSHRRR
jgi:hypothetical protein